MQLRFFYTFLLFVIGVASAYAITSGREPKASWLITFPEGAPEAFISSSIEQLKKAGADVTHTFTFIKSYAFTATESVIDMFKNLDTQATANAAWKPIIEKDSVVTALGGNN
ncbi:hypothetical protein H072_7280 [Dactylellina haptotyla CBS 200.50]|uniref:Inhibitor I9 domain-containing protein n=1 Tax=Dactylellina haptotyla (strain CBS 200.50) TaxID=1284197 RepID=S8ACY6_DACHA|nr:hypothetical protein H072_7280 [Dactylellina haptotyla CBS 200.50]